MFQSLLASTLLAMSASAAVMAPEALPTWKVTGFNAGCARRGCTYEFTVSAPASGAIPAFSAKCSGEENRSLTTYFVPCNVNDGGKGNRGVGAKYLPRENINTGTLKAIVVTFAYTDISSGTAGAVHNYTGQAPITINQAVAPAYDFTITPKET